PLEQHAADRLPAVEHRELARVAVVELRPLLLPVREELGTVLLELAEPVRGTVDPPVDELVGGERREPPWAGPGGGQEPLARELLDDAVRLDPVHRRETGELARGLRPGPAGRQVEAGTLLRHPVLGEEFEKAR